MLNHCINVTRCFSALVLQSYKQNLWIVGGAPILCMPFFLKLLSHPLSWSKNSFIVSDQLLIFNKSENQKSTTIFRISLGNIMCTCYGYGTAEK